MITYKGEKKTALNKDNDNIRTTSRIISYHFNNFESSILIEQQEELPLIGQEHPDDPSLICTNINTGEPQSNDFGKSGIFDVVCSYSNERDSVSVGSQSTKPWKLPPYDISYPPFESIVPIEKVYQSGDSNGNPTLPYLNSAKDPIVDTKTENSWKIKFSYNLKTVNQGWLDYFLDTVNNTDIVIVGFNVPSGKGRLRQLQPDFQRTYDSNGNILWEYWKMSVEIEVKKQKWIKEPLNQGLNVISGGKKYRAYTDNNGNYGTIAGLISGGADAEDIVAVDEPLKLDANGGLLSQEGDTVTYAGPYYDKFYTSWKPLSFPKSVRG